MKKLLLLALIVLGSTYSNAQSLSFNEVFDVLIKWEGQWKNSAVFEESVWIRESEKSRGRTNSSLILSNNYLEININNGDKKSKTLFVTTKIQKNSIDGNLKIMVLILFGLENGIKKIKLWLGIL